MRNLLCLIMVICLHVAPAEAQTLYNFDFENWYADSSGQDRLDLWKHVDKNGVNRTQLHGTQRTEQSHTGSYAVTLHRWYMVDKDLLTTKDSISGSPGSLNGFYKYTDAILNSFDDTAAINVYVTKWNSVTNHADTIGYGYRELAASTGYTPFSCNITYIGAGQPDSFCIYLTPSKFSVGTMCRDSPDCSFFTIDNLSFSVATGFDTIAEDERLTIYPNPADEFIMLKGIPASSTVKVYNAFGALLSEQNIVDGKLGVGNLPPGYYSLIATGKDKLFRASFMKR